MMNLGQWRIVIRVPTTFQEKPIFRRSYVSCRHKEPKDLSWQWSVKKTPELMTCKNLCVSKICPKPSFLFPRFRKVFVPADKKACHPKKKSMTWKEYFSYLLPDNVPKPPLIKCRKLQAERRRCCGNPMNCTEDCLRVNCCPPPKEWYGQAEIFAVPSSLPPRAPRINEPQPCAPPPPSEPTCVLVLKGICPVPKKVLNMDDYAYKKAFSGVNVCEEIRQLPSSFQNKTICVPQLPGSGKSLRLSCGFFSEFKEVECPKGITSKGSGFDLPPLICSDKPSKEYPKEVNVEVKKGTCGRTTFLKPYKYGDKLPGSDDSCKFHTIAFNMKPQMYIQKKKFHSTSQSLLKSPVKGDGGLQQAEPIKADPRLVDMGMPAEINKNSYCQPSKSGVGLHYMLLKPLSGRLRDGLYAAPEPYNIGEEMYYNYHNQEIDPELLKLAEETKKNMTYGVPTIKNEKKDPATTLAKQLSKVAEEKMIKKIKEKGEERPITPNKNSYQKSKLSLLHKRKNPSVATRATFMTEANLNVKNAKKKDSKGSAPSTKNTICEGCLGIKEAEKEEKNPTPKSFIDCKVRPAGRCRGPQRKVHPDEGEPQNPYYKNKQKPYSLCNQQRPVIKKKERPYKMPCEDRSPTKREFHSSTSLPKSDVTNINKSTKKKFHSTTSLYEAETNIPTLYDILKGKGLNKSTKQAYNHSNDWDSHTSDSYGEKTHEEYDAVPDLSKFQPKEDDTTIKKMSYPVKLWENPEGKKKTGYNSWSNNEGSAHRTPVGLNRIENLHQNVTIKKRSPTINITKDSKNISSPSKFNALFNQPSLKKQCENNNNYIHHTNNQDNMTFNEKKLASSKIYDFKSENRETNVSNSREQSKTCPITTQNMWGEPQYLSTSQNSQSMDMVSQELKSWDKQKSHTLLKDNLMNECDDDWEPHDLFRSKDETNKVLSKVENESQNMYFKEKMSMLPVSEDIDNITNINGSKS